jgi:hypothetical protein
MALRWQAYAGMSALPFGDDSVLAARVRVGESGTTVVLSARQKCLLPGRGLLGGDETRHLERLHWDNAGRRS